MDDDFNTSEAIAALQGLARELNTARTCASESHKRNLLAGELRAMGGVLGILRVPPAQWFRAGANASGLGDTESMRVLRPVWKRARPGIGPNPTGSATNWRRPASSSRTSRAASPPAPGLTG